MARTASVLALLTLACGPAPQGQDGGSPAVPNAGAAPPRTVPRATAPVAPGDVPQRGSGGTVEPPLPFEDVGACPFEGCVYREWTTTRPVTVRTDRRDDAPVAFELPAGTRVTALTGVVMTMTPGLIEFSEPTDVQTGQGVLRMRPGETLYVLTSQGEGFVKGWAHGRLYTDVDASRLAARRVATSVWWVQVRSAAGQTGWTRHPEWFDGKDAHA